MVNRPHPLAWFVALIVGIAVVVAVTADGKEPSWALRSEWVYRAEVGAAIVGLLYVPLVALSLAWRGQTLRRIQAPGGAGVEFPAERIGTAAERFGRYDKQLDERFERLESAVDKLNQRVEKLEGGKNGGG